MMECLTLPKSQDVGASISAVVRNLALGRRISPLRGRSTPPSAGAGDRTTHRRFSEVLEEIGQHDARDTVTVGDLLELM